jgi:hypothetical protein
VLVLVTATFAAARGPVAGAGAGYGYGYCATCHPSAHPDKWATGHGAFKTTDPAEYAACADCHQASFCTGCHKSGY